MNSISIKRVPFCNIYYTNRVGLGQCWQKCKSFISWYIDTHSPTPSILSMTFWFYGIWDTQKMEYKIWKGNIKNCFSKIMWCKYRKLCRPSWLHKYSHCSKIRISCLNWALASFWVFTPTQKKSSVGLIK